MYHGTHRPEDTLERLVRNPILQRHIDRIALALPAPFVLLRSRAGKVLPELVEAARHDAVRGVERLLDAVAMMAVDVYVQHPWVCAQKLERAKNNIIDVAETGSFPLFGMVQASGPVDGDVRCARGNLLRCA